MDENHMQKISSDRLPVEMNRRQLLRWAIATVLVALLFEAPCAVAACDDSTDAVAVVFKPVSYSGKYGASFIKQLQLDTTLSCVVTQAAPRGDGNTISVKDDVAYLTTRIRPNDAANAVYWPGRSDVIGGYEDKHVRTDTDVTGVCAAHGTLKIWPAVAIRIVLEPGAPGADLSSYTFESDAAQYVSGNTDACESDLGGFHSVAMQAVFKVNPTDSRCIFVAMGPEYVAWIPIKDLVKPRPGPGPGSAPIETYLDGSCSTDVAANPAAHFQGAETRKRNEQEGLLRALKGATLHFETVPPVPSPGP